MPAARFVFGSACLGLLLFGVGLITLGSVASGLQEKFHLDPIASGSLFSILPIGILAGSLLFGPFSDRYGYKIILLLSCLLMFTGFQGIAFASFGFLKICVFLFGLGGGMINGASNAVVADISKTNKSANLSLLGVFFAVGALGMPAILGILESRFSYQTIVSSVGYLPIVVAALFTLTQFPEPKHKEAIPFSKSIALLRDPVLILIGFFLFFQASFEAVINNWTTTYLLSQLSVPISKALYALSLYVVGMAVMRIIIGSVLRKLTNSKILWLSFALLFTGSLLLQSAHFYSMAVAGLILIGAGLAAGFPVMLGLVGNRYAELSGTAFSFVLTIAMAGNILVNFLMGIVAEEYGIQHLTTIVLAMLAMMILLSFILQKKIKMEHTITF